MKIIKTMPEVNEAGNCSKHGEYDFRYLPMFNNKFMVSDQCPECANEKNKRDSKVGLDEELKAEKHRDHSFKINRGISRRNVDVTFDDFYQDLPNQKRAVKVMHKLGKDVFNGEQTPSVIITGGVGTGKTMLASAMLNRLGARKSLGLLS